MIMTRGHNTYNIAEASIRILKDIVLSRTKAFNAVALLESILQVWETCFQARILRHANDCIPSHHILCHNLLKRMPDGAAETIVYQGNQCYMVPSAKKNDVYEVYGDTGICTCPAGNTGAFCKHQALVQKKLGGMFPNGPTLSANDRRQLGWPTLGDNYPSIESYLSETANETEKQNDVHEPDVAPLPVVEGHRTPPDNEQDFPAQLPSTSGSEQEDTKVVDDNLEDFIKEMREVHAKEQRNDTYKRRLASAIARLKSSSNVVSGPL
ncbi:uncharacterized protein LOC119402849 [Rhipicephalus sanguineus]|uniref:uncharacterized protein LOC119402849 n=1 Tax=Rhipicephalus sanguineus TaxID=34632 RepID=UPI0020C1C101|nr:uncharacterized protein LOC119402849 [Rhipicephalus sanguineus]